MAGWYFGDQACGVGETGLRNPTFSLVLGLLLADCGAGALLTGIVYLVQLRKVRPIRLKPHLPVPRISPLLPKAARVASNNRFRINGIVLYFASN